MTLAPRMGYKYATEINMESKEEKNRNTKKETEYELSFYWYCQTEKKHKKVIMPCLKPMTVNFTL